LLRENLLLYSSYLPLGVPNWTVKNYQHRAASATNVVAGGEAEREALAVRREWRG
jgi:hypothetical protein